MAANVLVLPESDSMGKEVQNISKNVTSHLAHDLADSNVIRTEDICTSEDVEFKNLLLPDFILRGLTAANFHRPSPIQLRSIPLLRLGLDLIVQSKAGTGKTLVIAMAALETVKFESKRLQVLVVAPTREIALQTKHFISILCLDVPVRTEAFIGGISIKEDKKNLLGCQIAIGTPGRLNSLIESGFLSLGNVRLFVLDEADKLMEKPLFSQVKSISKLLPPSKQTILCSATFLNPVKEYVMRHMKEPFWVSPEGANRLQEGNLVPQKSVPTVLLGVKQFVKEVPHHAQIVKKLHYKLEEILEILSSHSFSQCIIFSNYQTRAETICHQLVSNGWPAMSVRGQDEQSHRSATLTSFKERRCRVLLTTDVMSRGVDFRGVDLVINLDIPYDSSTYLHRTGRAGRFGSHGCVITLASIGEEVESFKKILIEINDVTVYSLPSDLSLIKQEDKFHYVFYGPILDGDGSLCAKDVGVNASNTASISIENLELGVDNVIDEKLNSDLQKVSLKSLSYDSQTKQDKTELENCKSNDFSRHDLNPLVKRILLSETSTEITKTSVENASVHLFKAVCCPKVASHSFKTFEELEALYSGCMDNNSDQNIVAPLQGSSFPQDWWKSAAIILSEASLNLKELREMVKPKISSTEVAGNKKLKGCFQKSANADHTNSHDVFTKLKGKKKSSKSIFSRQGGPDGGFREPSTSTQYDTGEWLWDDASNLYYVWDSNCSCYYLFNPNSSCYFKWEPESNKYFKWDAVSQNYVSWDCYVDYYQEASSSSSNSFNSNENYIDWFKLWNKQLQQMKAQVYQTEYLKSMCSQFKKF